MKTEYYRIASIALLAATLVMPAHADSTSSPNFCTGTTEPAMSSTVPALHPFRVVSDGVTNDAAGGANYSFGSFPIDSDKPLAHDFTLQNTTAAPVVLDQIKTSCGCTTATVGTGTNGACTTIPAGKQITVHVSIDPSLLSRGDNNKFVYVNIVGQTDPALTIDISGTGTTSVYAKPSALDFGSVQAGAQQSLPIKVTYDRSLYRGKLPAPSCDNPDVKIALNTSAPEISAGSVLTRTYTVTLLPHAHLGNVDATINIPKPGNKDTVSVYVRGCIQGDLACQPSAVEFGSVTHGSTATCKVCLTGVSQQVLEGLKVQCGSPDLTAKIVPTTSPNATASSKPMCVLEVTYAPKTPGDLEANVTVTTKSGQTLDLPAQAYVN
jgi:hypothetical protein